MKKNFTLKERLSDYKYREVLGKGAFATTYLFHHKDNSADNLVVKEIEVTKPRDLELYGTETEVLRRLKKSCQGKNILCSNAIYQRPSYVYFTTEYINGQTLNNAFRTLKKTKDATQIIQTTLKWFAQLIKAVNYIHSVNIIHSDIKPENIMIDKNMDLKLIDFGLSAIVEEDGSNEVRIHGGTPYYMPDYIYRIVFKTPIKWINDDEARHLDLHATIKSFYDPNGPGSQLGFAYIFTQLKDYINIEEMEAIKSLFKKILQNKVMSYGEYKKAMKELSKF